MRLPLAWEPRQDDKIYDPSAVNAMLRLHELNNRTQRLRVDAVNNTRQSQAKQRIRYNTLVQPRSFRVDDLVYIAIGSAGAVNSAKFSETIQGPYVVIGVNGNGTYRIKDSVGNIDRVHIDRMEPARITQDRVPIVLSANRPLTHGIRQYRRD
ncbi:hypothetical protein BGZ98_005881 [Dissophora globulifera]|nr:hypothetical protein BGZ98_005881 [Dissophora globulifera]